MTATPSDLERLQLDIEGFLLSHEELQFASVTHVRPRTAEEAVGIQTWLDQALAGLLVRNGKRGVSIIVTMPELVKVEPNSRALCGDMLIGIDVAESLLINMGPDGTQISAETFALTIATLLNHQVFSPWAPVVGDPKMISPLAESVIDKKVVYRITLKVTYRGPNKPKVDYPKLVQAGSQITLTCATAEAQIWWTMDGTFPGPGNESAVLYDQPVPLPAGVHCIRAGAYRSGHVASNTLRQMVTVE